MKHMTAHQRGRMKRAVTQSLANAQPPTMDMTRRVAGPHFSGVAIHRTARPLHRSLHLHRSHHRHRHRHQSLKHRGDQEQAHRAESKLGRIG